jgi:hypothetical protein
MTRSWIGSGPEYSIEWGGLSWSLPLDRATPGLFSDPFGPLLGLEGLAEPGHTDPEALSGASLLGHECRFDRVEATYSPSGWGELFVRAAWSPFGDHGMDLEIQVHARSVDRLRATEVKLLSKLGDLPPEGSLRSVEPRDRTSAGLSYDGREVDLSGLVTGPPAALSGPWLAPKTGREGWTYVEMARPEDASRRILEGRLPFVASRYGLFGHDLERGVVLRGRLRAFWLPKASAFGHAEREYRRFIDEPPPLST